jgi:hydrogenase maturation protease
LLDCRVPNPLEPSTVTPILVLGIGNILLKDEGVGVHVVEAMAGQAAPPQDVEFVDGGTFGPDLIDIIANRRKVIVVDAVQAAGSPGTVLRFTDKDLAAHYLAPGDSPGAKYSIHEVGLLETLLMAKQLGCAPQEVVIVGVIPKDISPGLEMTAEVTAVVPKIIELVRKELGRP